MLAAANLRRIARTPWRGITALFGLAMLIAAVVLWLTPSSPAPAIRVTAVNFIDGSSAGGHQESANVYYTNDSDQTQTIASFFATQFLPATTPVGDGVRSVRSGVGFSLKFYRKAAPVTIGPHESGWVTVVGPVLDEAAFEQFIDHHTARFYVAGIIRAADATGAVSDVPFCRIGDGTATPVACPDGGD